MDIGHSVQMADRDPFCDGGGGNGGMHHEGKCGGPVKAAKAIGVGGVASLSGQSVSPTVDQRLI